MQHITAAALAAACLLAVASPAAAFSQGPWMDARATYYGLDAWSIHTGSCGYGFICPDRWSDELVEGQDVTAVSDQGPFYGHCGECLEVKCRATKTLPANPGTLDRSEYCNNEVDSVKVKIVDTCPCNYKDNEESNKKWCCGDYLHLDMSQWALQKLVNEIGQGVFGISVRTVDCKAEIANPAPPLATPLVDPHEDLKPAKLDCSAGTQATGSPGSSGTGGDTAATSSSARVTRRTSVASTPAPTPAPTKQASRKELTTESTTTRRASVSSSSPTAAPTSPQFSLSSIQRPSTPGAVKMAVPWWRQRQQEYLAQGSTDKSSGLPTSGSTANYWTAWWLNIFPKYSNDQKTSVYKQIWQRITAGTLNVAKYGAPGGKK